jgi:hypothetical protein
MTNSQRLESSQGFEALDPGLRYYGSSANLVGGNEALVVGKGVESGFFEVFEGLKT